MNFSAEKLIIQFFQEIRKLRDLSKYYKCDSFMDGWIFVKVCIVCMLSRSIKFDKDVESCEGSRGRKLVINVWESVLDR